MERRVERDGEDNQRSTGAGRLNGFACRLSGATYESEDT